MGYITCKSAKKITRRLKGRNNFGMRETGLEKNLLRCFSVQRILAKGTFETKIFFIMKYGTVLTMLVLVSFLFII